MARESPEELREERRRQWRLGAQVLAGSFEAVAAPVAGFYLGRALADKWSAAPYVGLAVGVAVVVSRWVWLLRMLGKRR